MRRSFHRSGARWNFLRGMTQHEEQTGETEVEPGLAPWRAHQVKARFTGRVWKEVLCAVLKVCQIFVYFEIGDWSNGMIGVSKTFGGSSILSSPAPGSAGSLDCSRAPAFFIF